ncbi:hypothetical protein J2Y02_000469 [Neobacillus drentensis]|nr:hypothetical protein [Neobacillus drentensis]
MKILGTGATGKLGSKVGSKHLSSVRQGDLAVFPKLS